MANITRMEAEQSMDVEYNAGTRESKTSLRHTARMGDFIATRCSPVLVKHEYRNI